MAEPAGEDAGAPDLLARIQLPLQAQPRGGGEAFALQEGQQVEFEVVPDFTASARGAGGFGSTGKG